MRGKVLLDTHIVLGCLKGAPAVVNFVNAIAPECLCVSVISRMDLLSFHGIPRTKEA